MPLSTRMTEPTLHDYGSHPGQSDQSYFGFYHGVIIDPNLPTRMKTRDLVDPKRERSPWMRQRAPSRFEKPDFFGFGFLEESTSGPSDYTEIASGLVRVRADYSRSEPIFAGGRTRSGFFADGLPSAVASFDFHFGFRRVLGATVIPSSAWSSKRLSVHTLADSKWVQFGDMQIVGDDNLVAADPSLHSNDYLRLPPHFSPLIRQARDHEGVYLSQIHSRIMQVRLNPGHGISVFDGAILDDNLAQSDAKSGEVWWLDFALDTGRIISAHMQQNNRSMMILIPFDDLQYDHERQGFIIRKSPGVAGTPDIAAAAALGKIEKRPDRFH
jgi:hypothetical protein